MWSGARQRNRTRLARVVLTWEVLLTTPYRREGLRTCCELVSHERQAGTTRNVAVRVRTLGDLHQVGGFFMEFGGLSTKPAPSGIRPAGLAGLHQVGVGKDMDDY